MPRHLAYNANAPMSQQVVAPRHRPRTLARGSCIPLRSRRNEHQVAGRRAISRQASGFATVVERRVDVRPRSRDTECSAGSRPILLLSSITSVKTSAWRRNSSATIGGLTDIDETTVT
jgi:hypothetical protein